ncbi:hypothetical protein [Cellulomonas pakistanensis]|uniref:hypothetical protein n=1 Tax=Cellulomonas pakistanensis TaxID=992287 RepID=UPI00194500AB|nr:hypothetical protein [Cellulomonas pakistanensis]
MPRRSQTPIPGLVERTEPLAPGEAHVDPADPRGHRAPPPGLDLWSWQMQVFSGTAPVLSVVAVGLALQRGAWPPLVGAALFLLSAVATWSTRERYRGSRRGRRDLLRVSGGMLIALVLLLGGVPFLAP